MADWLQQLMPKKFWKEEKCSLSKRNKEERRKRIVRACTPSGNLPADRCVSGTINRAILVTGFLHWCVNLGDAVQSGPGGWIDRIYPKTQLTKTWVSWWSSSFGSMEGQHLQMRERLSIDLGVGRTLPSWSDYWFLKYVAQTGHVVLVCLKQDKNKF